MTLFELAALVRGAAWRVVGGIATIRSPHRSHPLDDRQITPPAGTAVTWTGAELLIQAAKFLPTAPAAYVPSAIHEALFDAACVLRGDADSAAAHRMADEAEALLAAYLVGTFQAPPRGSVAETLRVWPDRRALVPVVSAMAASARYWKRYLATPRASAGPRSRRWLPGSRSLRRPSVNGDMPGAATPGRSLDTVANGLMKDEQPGPPGGLSAVWGRRTWLNASIAPAADVGSEPPRWRGNRSTSTAVDAA